MGKEKNIGFLIKSKYYADVAYMIDNYLVWLLFLSTMESAQQKNTIQSTLRDANSGDFLCGASI